MPTTRPGSRCVQTFLNEETFKRIQAIAIADNRPLSSYIRNLILADIEKRTIEILPNVPPVGR